MPAPTLTDEQIAYRSRFAASAVQAGSERIGDLIDAGPEARVHRAVFRAHQLREDVQRLATEHPELRLIAAALAVEEQRLREYAKAV